LGLDPVYHGDNSAVIRIRGVTARPNIIVINTKHHSPMLCAAKLL